MNLIAWGPGAWAPEAWARYAWEDDGGVPSVEEVSTGAGSGGKAKRKRYPTREQVTPQPRDSVIEEVAQRRQAQRRHQEKARTAISPTLPPSVRRIVEKAAEKPWPALTQQAVTALPGGKEKWAKRRQLELAVLLAKFQDRIAARMELARYEAALQDELIAAAARELDVVFVAAVMALTDED